MLEIEILAGRGIEPQTAARVAAGGLIGRERAKVHDAAPFAEAARSFIAAPRPHPYELQFVCAGGK
jgi:hypothetical protein